VRLGNLANLPEYIKGCIPHVIQFQSIVPVLPFLIGGGNNLLDSLVAGNMEES
jgi:hypothetical protein